MELLAPAGDYAAFLAAVGAGADAVYLAGKQFGARAQAGNFSAEELERAIRYAHVRGVRIYVTVNTLLADQETAALIQFVKDIERLGADAVIVQDLGVAALVRQHTALPIHASTQMTITDVSGVLLAQEIGMERAVLARELSLPEIKGICEQSPLEIEVFGHGALCISYSGQCLMSSMIGGRSGNRGRCAQPCRLPYHLAKQGGQPISLPDYGEYLLSPKDLCAVRHLPALLAAGVHSFKIEGRMKRPEYVAAVVSSYREAINVIQSGGTPDYDRLEQRMAQVFSRGFTAAYLEGKRGAEMMSHRRPNNRGLQVGRVHGYNRDTQRVELQLEQPIQQGDILEIWTRIGGRATVTVQRLERDGIPADRGLPGERVVLSQVSTVQKQDRVFKVFDAPLMAELARYQEVDEQKLPVTARVSIRLGQPFRILLTDGAGHEGEGVSDKLAEAALRHPITADTVTKQIQRLGDTDFRLHDLQLELDDGLMVPVSEMNKARRMAVDNLMAARLAAFPVLRRHNRQPVPALAVKPQRGRPQLAVRVYNLVQAEAAIAGGADQLLYYGELFAGCGVAPDDYPAVWHLCRQRKVHLQYVLPRAVRPSYEEQVWAAAAQWDACPPDSLLAGSWDMVYQARQRAVAPVYGDYSLNVFNRQSCQELTRYGLSGCTASPELTLEQLQVLSAGSPLPVGCIVHSRLPLMVLEHCVVGSALGGNASDHCNHPCRENYELIDRKGERFPVLCDRFGRNHVLNARILAMGDRLAEICRTGVAQVQIDGIATAAGELRKVVTAYRQGVQTGVSISLEGLVPAKTVTRGHYFRGTD